METSLVPFVFARLEIHDIVLIKAEPFTDRRGVFVESYRRSEFSANGIPYEFVQDNYSHSVRGVLRGLHYQDAPHEQGKLVSVVRGEIFDVAVDIRQQSPTYRQWVGVRMSSAEPAMLYIPDGFAHGFQVLSAEADVIYKVTKEYSPHADRGIAWNDPELKIPWPIPDPILSDKDAALPLLCKTQYSIVLDDPSG
jgi:dTDP-4-dehydrorhamnose 3,5-epimerase